jgi:hypothetical protein
MATFPALRPAYRRYSFGQFPVTVDSVRFLHGGTSSGHTLELSFVLLTEAEAALLREHYRVQQGGFLPFSLSDEAWAGHSSLTDLVPTTTQWIYADQPEETHRKGSLYDVTVRLESVI